MRIYRMSVQKRLFLPTLASRIACCELTTNDSWNRGSESKSLMVWRGRHKQKRSCIWRTYENKPKREKNVLDLSKTNAVCYTRPNITV